MTRLVVFDLDGTLVDSSQDLAAALNASLRRVAPATPLLPLSEVRGMIGDGARQLVARGLARAGLGLSPEEVLPVFLEEYGVRLLETTRPYEGVAEALDALVPRRLAVLTNKPGDMSRRILDGLGLGGRFFRVLGGGDLGSKKPDPEGLLLLLAEAGAAPGEAVLVGDSAVDVRTAHAAGVRAVGVSYGLGPESLRETPPDLLLDDLRELPAHL
ncbi:MAG TPA: HAD-IA family hydrolase [Vicinamibacteria bacterium]